MLVYCWFCVAAKAISEAPTVRRPWTALASLAASLEVTRAGRAIAEMMAIIAITINSSTSEKPFSLFIWYFFLLLSTTRRFLLPHGGSCIYRANISYRHKAWVHESSQERLCVMFFIA